MSPFMRTSCWPCSSMQWLYLLSSYLWIPTGSQIIVLPGTYSFQRAISNGVRWPSIDTYEDCILFYLNQTVQTNRILSLMEGLLTARIRSNCPDFLGLLTIDHNVFLAYTDVFQGYHFDRGFQTARELICPLNTFQKNWLYCLLTLFLFGELYKKLKGTPTFIVSFNISNAFSLDTNSEFLIPLPGLTARDSSVQEWSLVVERHLGEHIEVFSALFFDSVLAFTAVLSFTCRVREELLLGCWCWVWLKPWAA